MAENNQEEVQSPCIGVCSMDDSTGYCLGCYRTADEIRGWWNMNSVDQKKLLVELDERQNRAVDFD